MNFLSKLLLLSLSLFMVASLSSCEKESCYECDTYERGSGIIVQGDTYCSSKNLSEAQVEELVDFHVSGGGTCTKL